MGLALLRVALPFFVLFDFLVNGWILVAFVGYFLDNREVGIGLCERLPVDFSLSNDGLMQIDTVGSSLEYGLMA